MIRIAGIGCIYGFGGSVPMIGIAGISCIYGFGGSMRQKKNYGAIDNFRLAAAFFIVAIHTGPLQSFS